MKPETEPPGTALNVRGGTLDDTSWLRPTVHPFTWSKQPWVILPADATVHETAPDRA